MQEEKHTGVLIRHRVKQAALLVFVLLVFVPIGPARTNGGALGWWQMGGWALRQPAVSASVKSPVVGVLQPDAPPPSTGAVQLDVKNIRQLPQLINGCEATSLTIVLNYLGYGADKMDIAYHFMPRVPFEFEEKGRVAANPANAYPGDPGTTSGYYCYPDVVAETANLYLAYQGASIAARNITGADEQDLLAQLDRGNPVIVWRSIDMQPLYTNRENGWFLSDTGEFYAPYMNMHVVVLTGYDEEYFYFCDPLNLLTKIKRSSFMPVFEQVGSMAVVLGG